MVTGCATAALKPRRQAGASVCGNFLLHRASRLLLNHQRAGPNIRPRYEITDLQLHEVTAAQLAVYGEVEQRPIPQPCFAIEEETDRPDLFLGEGTLRADRFASIPCDTVLHCRIKVRVGHRPSPWPRLAKNKQRLTIDVHQS
jgi:hypothetical protein